MASKTLLSTGLILISLAIATPASAGLYKYVSKDGTVHFTDSSTSSKYSSYIVPKHVAYSIPGSGIDSDSVSELNQKKGRGTAAKRVDRAGIDLLIKKYSRENGLDAVFVNGIVNAESAFNPNAVSPAGAMGLMQLMPSTAKRFGVSDPFNPEENVRAGTEYMKKLIKKYSGNKVLALAAYNAGEEVVAKYSGVPPYPETVRYIDNVLAYEYANGVRESRDRAKAYKRIYRYIDDNGNVFMTDTPRGDLDIHVRRRAGR